MQVASMLRPPEPGESHGANFGRPGSADSAASDRAGAIIIAAVPIMDGKRTTDDARVLTMNSKAREILRIPEGKGHPHTVGRYLNAVLRWAPHSKSAQGQSTTIEYADPDGARFLVTIEMINHFILISLAAAVAEEAEAPSRSRFARLLGLIEGQVRPAE
jgi:hypothetical protein